MYLFFIVTSFSCNGFCVTNGDLWGKVLWQSSLCPALLTATADITESWARTTCLQKCCWSRILCLLQPLTSTSGSAQWPCKTHSKEVANCCYNFCSGFGNCFKKKQKTTQTNQDINKTKVFPYPWEKTCSVITKHNAPACPSPTETSPIPRTLWLSIMIQKNFYAALRKVWPRLKREVAKFSLRAEHWQNADTSRDITPTPKYQTVILWMMIDLPQ